MSSVETQIRDKAIELGFDACAFTTAQPPEHAPEFERWLAAGKQGEMAWLQRNAEKRVQPDRVLPGAKSIILVAVSYARGSSISQITEAHRTKRGQIAQYARFTDYHDVMGEKLKALSAFTEELGNHDVRSLWYVDTGPILERDLAQRAGLGFVGKHTNLISRNLGNWFSIGEILTTLELQADSSEHNRCGSCTRCLQACPTGALTAPFQLDARRCISYLTIELKGSIPLEFRPAIGARIYGCDDCLAACPWNRFAREGALMHSHVKEELDTPDLIELLSLDDAGFKQRFAGTPVLRTKRRGLLRNVCVALGNVGDESCIPPLERAAVDPEPLIAEHARWAIQRIRERQRSVNS